MSKNLIGLCKFEEEILPNVDVKQCRNPKYWFCKYHSHIPCTHEIACFKYVERKARNEPLWAEVVE